MGALAYKPFTCRSESKVALKRSRPGWVLQSEVVIITVTSPESSTRGGGDEVMLVTVVEAATGAMESISGANSLWERHAK